MRQKPVEWRMARMSSAARPTAQSAPADEDVAQPGLSLTIPTVAVAILAHIGLALAAADGNDALATAHARATFAIGLLVAALTRPVYVALVVAYITGAEVFWRMVGADIPWEFGKYTAAAVMLVAVLRMRHFRRSAIPAVAYFLLLLPSTIMLLAEVPFAEARGQISFYLSGPLALAMGAVFFSRIELTPDDARTVLLAGLIPIVSIATLAWSGSFAGDVIFTHGSNLAASGGFGPNQVSAALGLGALLALLVAFDWKAPRLLRGAMLGAVVGFGVLSALTFSRGGLYTAGGGAMLATFFATRDSRLRWQVVPPLVGVLLIGNFFARPYLNAFTGGAIGARFEDTSLTGRDRLIQADLELWRSNLIFGVGPGGGGNLRGEYFINDPSLGTLATATTRIAAAHTEFSRVLAEHGSLGLAGMVLLVLAGFWNIHRAPDARTKGLVAALGIWSALFMLSNATRLVAPSTCIALGFATFARDRRVAKPDPLRRRRVWNEPTPGGAKDSEAA